jgi:hypothetical protein
MSQGLAVQLLERHNRLSRPGVWVQTKPTKVLGTSCLVMDLVRGVVFPEEMSIISREAIDELATVIAWSGGPLRTHAGAITEEEVIATVTSFNDSVYTTHEMVLAVLLEAARRNALHVVLEDTNIELAPGLRELVAS